jgi:hypothetical protein
MTLLDEKSKFVLRSNGSLVTNNEGDEVLLGLTASESDFVLTFAERPDQDHEAAAQLLYVNLRHKHLKARVMRLLQPNTTEHPDSSL